MMPRDGSGNYTLPAGNPVATGTIIASSWANPTMADIAVQLNNVLTRDGVLGPVQPFKLVDGTVAAPGLSFNSEPGLGAYRPSASVINFAAANAITGSLDSSSGNNTLAKLYPRLAGTSASNVVVSNQPSGTANRTEMSLGIGAVTGALTQTGFGTGTKIGLSVDVGNVNVVSSGSTAGLAVTDTGGNGGNIKFTGNGAVTPSKSIRVQSGQMQWLNSAYSQVILTLTDTGDLTAAGNITAFSDRRLKDNIELATGALQRILSISGYSYTRDGRPDRGVMSDELTPVYPELVFKTSEGYDTVNYFGLISELVMAIRELNAKIES